MGLGFKLESSFQNSVDANQHSPREYSLVEDLHIFIHMFSSLLENTYFKFMANSVLDM